MTYWVYPLPPPGPLAFVREWPALGLFETLVEIDAQPILDAAARSVQIWPDDDEPNSNTTTAIVSAPLERTERHPSRKDPSTVHCGVTSRPERLLWIALEFLDLSDLARHADSSYRTIVGDRW